MASLKGIDDVCSPAGFGMIKPRGLGGLALGDHCEPLLCPGIVSQ